jgi:hypothetical protein
MKPVFAAASAAACVVAAISGLASHFRVVSQLNKAIPTE